MCDGSTDQSITPSACQRRLERGNESRHKELTVWKVNTEMEMCYLGLVLLKETQYQLRAAAAGFFFFSSCLYVEMEMCDNEYIRRLNLISFESGN